jgi:hypothetical protein
MWAWGTSGRLQRGVHRRGSQDVPQKQPKSSGIAAGAAARRGRDAHREANLKVEQLLDDRVLGNQDLPNGLQGHKRTQKWLGLVLLPDKQLLRGWVGGSTPETAQAVRREQQGSSP